MSWPGSQRLGALSTGALRPLPPRPQRAAGRVSGSLQTGTGACLPGGRRWEGVASLGLSFPFAPPPASYLQRGWAGSSLEFLSPFVLRTAGGVFRPVNFFSRSPTV